MVSDSHGRIQPVAAQLREQENLSLILHLGDFDADGKALGEWLRVPVRAVAGNCDTPVYAEERPGIGSENEAAGPDFSETDVLLSLGGRKILLTHGHRHQIKYGSDRLGYYAREREADACLFGHTHIPAIFMLGPVFFMNPGSLGRPVDATAHDGYRDVNAKGFKAALDFAGYRDQVDLAPAACWA